jgi:hypothetical protein
MRRRPRLLLLVGIAGLVAVAAATAAGPPVAVKSSKRNETAPAAGGEWFAWSKSRANYGSPSDVWAQRLSEPSFKVNPRNTQAYTGGIDSTRLVYQVLFRSGAGGSDLRLFDLQTRRHVPLPRSVNSPRWECCPTLSGDWLLFGRGVAYSQNLQLIMLRNLVTGEERVLDQLVNRNGLLAAGQISGNFAVWGKCNPYPRCQIARYDVAAGSVTRLAVPPGKVVYSPSVTRLGTTYYGRSNVGCGKAVELVKEPLLGLAEVLVRLPAGQDLDVTSAIVQVGQPADTTISRVYYDRIVCKRRAWDILSVSDLDRGPPPPPQ